MINQQSVINLAIEAGVIDSADINSIHICQAYIDDLTAFARLIQNALINTEREACARLCETQIGLLDETGQGKYWGYRCAEAIRKGRAME